MQWTIPENILMSIKSLAAQEGKTIEAYLTDLFTNLHNDFQDQFIKNIIQPVKSEPVITGIPTPAKVKATETEPVAEVKSMSLGDVAGASEK